MYSIVSSSVDDQMGGTDARIEQFDLQFSVISRAEDGGVELADIVRKLVDWFDERSLTMAGFTHIRNERNGIAPIIVVDEVWQSTILYTIWVSWS